jgi:hypothetical protein
MLPYYQVHKDSSEGTDRDMKEQERKQIEMKSNQGHEFE